MYWLTLAPGVLAGDAGEFQLAAPLLGVAHATGYPLYLLLGWVWSHLVPAGDPAYRLNLLSAVWGALAVGLLYLVANRLVRQAVPELLPAGRRLAAAGAAALLAVTPTFWSQAVIAEVYTLHMVLVVAMVHLLLGWREAQDPARASRALLLAACCFGLALAHHRTILVLVPAIAAFLWLGRWPLAGPGRGRALWLVVAVLAPLALYLLIPWRAAATPYLHLPLAKGRTLALYDNSLAGLLGWVLGGPFGGSIDLSVSLADRLAMAARLLWAEMPWPALILAAMGVAWLAYRRQWANLALTGLAYAGTVAFNLVYTIGDIYVLFIPSYAMAALWLAVGAGAVAQGTSGRALGISGQARGRIAAACLVPVLALPVWWAAGQYAGLDRSGDTAARSSWEAILAEPLPEGAVLVSDDRNDLMPMWYMQYVEGRRTDLLGLFPLITPDYPTLGHVLDLALDTGRPVYVIKDMPSLEVKVQTEPEGRLWRVAGRAAGSEPEQARDIDLAGAVRLQGYDQAPRSPRPGDTVRVSLYWQPQRALAAVYHSFVHVVDTAGQPIAQSDHQPGGVYWPSTLWQAGELLRDDHWLTILPETAPGVYRLLVGLYELAPDGTLRPLGEPAVAGWLAVKTQIETQPGPIARPAAAEFGTAIELLGYDAPPAAGELAVTLYWRARRPPDQDYTVFVHLLDASGQIVAQADSPPRGGTYPTSVWDTGEVVADEHAIRLPEGLPAGEYWLRVGLYSAGADRLPVRDGGDSVELGPVVVR